MSAGHSRAIRLGDRSVHPLAALAVVAGAIGLLVAAPQLLLAVSFAAAGIAGLGLALDLAPTSRAVNWNDFRRTSSDREASDRRVQSLAARLGRTARASAAATTGDDHDHDELADALLAVIDDLLHDEHGIDRAEQPQAAARVLGPELTAFVDDAAVRRSMVRTRSLDSTLTLIEAL